MNIRRLLIANRAEIAVRLCQAASSSGIESVAVYASDDSSSGHVAKADQAVALDGRGPSAYLDVDGIVAAALSVGADAVHPGYGFLSENPALATACAAAGVRFVGPTAEVLELFGDKPRAREQAAELGVPTLEATEGATSLVDARRFFASLSEPKAVMIKAVAGGAGRGMRTVGSIEELDEGYATCRAEAGAAFGDDRVFVERLLPRARHIEVQVVGDGRAVTHVWDRDCSVQRHRQKVVELAPAFTVTDEVRSELWEAAIALADAAALSNIGTAEFLVQGKNFYFLEFNPRLQVEHTVTEEVTGIDLVETQLRLANGATLEELGLTLGHVPPPRGAALQVRVYSERRTVDGGLVPSTGTLTRFQPPTGRGIRVDTSAYLGYDVSPRYDSLLAKLIVHSPATDLGDIARRTVRALREFDIAGVDTNLELVQAILEGKAFRAGATTTDFVDTHLDELLEVQAPSVLVPEASPLGEGPVLGDVPVASDVVTERLEEPGLVDCASPLHGVVSQILVEAGDEVPAGTQVAIIEAMKMEHPVIIETAGVVDLVVASVGEVVGAGAPLLLLRLIDTDKVTGTVEESIDLDSIRPDLAELQTRRAGVLDEGRPDAVARRHEAGRRTARENIADLCDHGSFVEYGALAIAAQRQRRPLDDLISKTPADGMVTGIGAVDGGRVVVMSYDYTVLAGTQGLQNHRKTDRLVAIAEEQRLPVVVFAEGGGGRPGDTDTAGISNLDLPTFEAFARLSGTVPLVSIVAGYCFAGNVALAACSDVIIATRDANLGMGGPAMIQVAGQGEVAARNIGPSEMHDRNGVIDILVDDETKAVETARRYLSYFGPPVSKWTCGDQRLLRHLIPENRVRGYNIRPIIETLSDTGSILELRPRFGVGIVTALARIEGHAVGILANNTRHLGGAIDADGADKAARFLHLCDAFGIPIVTLCDTPGFMVGNEMEERAAIRHFGRFFIAGANRRVPMCTIILRKAYGLGPVAMSGGGLKAPLYTAAWPTAEFGGMALEGAVELAHRRELEAIPDAEARRERYEQLVAEMYERGKALSVATAFEVDDVIDPANTRRALADALASTQPVTPGGRNDYVDPW